MALTDPAWTLSALASKPLTEVLDPAEAIRESLALRFSNPPGLAAWPGEPDSASEGLDVAAMLGDTPSEAELATLEGQLAEQALFDPRIYSAEVVLSFVEGELTLRVDCETEVGALTLGLRRDASGAWTVTPAS